MAVEKITYSTKSNNASDPDSVRKMQFQDANEIKSVVNAHSDYLDSVLAALGITEGSGTIGEFVSLSVLQAAYPDGADGAYAVINDGLGGTPQVATYNVGTNLWELAVPDASIIWVANVGSLPGIGIAQKLYIALDTGAFYFWDGAQYQTAGPTQEVVVKYIENNGAQYRTVKGFGNSGSNFEAGDEITYRNPSTGKRGVYYVKDGNLTLPADFTDTAKIDRYPEQSPLL